MRTLRRANALGAGPSLPGRGPAFFTDPARRCSPAYAEHGLWTSDSAAKRRQAAVLCGDCPFTAECGAAADERRETFGVWGGVDRSEGSLPAGEAELIDRGLTNYITFRQLEPELQAVVVRGGLARGLTYIEMAKTLKRIISDLQRLAEPGKPTFDDQVRDLNAQGRNDLQIAATLGMSPHMVYDSRRRQALPGVRSGGVKPETESETGVRRLWDLNFDDGEISRELGLNIKTVYLIRQRLGLPAKFRGRRSRVAVPA